MYALSLMLSSERGREPIGEGMVVMFVSVPSCLSASEGPASGDERMGRANAGGARYELCLREVERDA